MTDWASPPLEGIVHELDTTMDREVRDLWIAGLRSGLYAQGYDRLRSIDDAYTPLGVLCDIASKVGVATWDRLGDEYFMSSMKVPATGSYVPYVIQEWAGFRGMHPSQTVPFYYNGHLHPIWRLSDIFKLTFTEIAQLLEDQY